MIVHISTSVTTGCKLCGERIGGDHFADSVNHYLQRHSYKLLHVGSETITSNDGKPCHATVAVLGEEKQPLL